jgi:hypothetical protein
MLVDIETGKQVKHIPHLSEFNLWKDRLDPKEFVAIIINLQSLMLGNEVHTSSWIPGNDWTNTVYDPIYSKACNNDMNLSGLCFGLFVWYAFQLDANEWYFGRFEKDGNPIKGMTYFKKTN